MCGFLGITSSKIIKYKNFNSALQKISHRGPDNSSIWIKNDSKIILGHNRLSIIDLSNHGNQPMSYVGRYKIIFNGEIYNFKELRKILENCGYKFLSNTDTEIILASYDKWRENSLQFFRGMFAFAIYDAKENNLFIARDRVGEKPLYYIKKSNEFLFSSEIKSLLELNAITPKVNFDTLDYMLTRGFTKNNNSLYENICKLPAGHFLNYKISDEKLIINKYWDLNLNSNTISKKINQIEEFDSIFKEVISLQLNSDVKTGVLLSGGIDSSLVTGIASLKNKNIKTFNVSFPNNSRYDESIYASQMSNFFKTDHYQIDIKNIEPTIIDEITEIYDEPLFDSSTIPTFLIFQEIKKNCKVVLGGDGGDEIFGGYRHYNYILYLKVLQKFIPEIFRKLIKNFILNKNKYYFKGENWVNNLDLNLNTNLPTIPKYFDNKEKIQIFLKNKKNIFNYKNVNKNDKNNNLVKSFMYENFKNYLCDDLLVKTDMASMKNSVELRSPFLDHKLIEFIFYNLNASENVNFFNRKIFIKKYASLYFPKNYKFNRKQGFSIPFKQWLKDSRWKEYIYDNILSSKNIFNREYAIDLMNKQNKGYDNSNKLYALLILILWFNKKKLQF